MSDYLSDYRNSIVSSKSELNVLTSYILANAQTIKVSYHGRNFDISDEFSYERAVVFYDFRLSNYLRSIRPKSLARQFVEFCLENHIHIENQTKAIDDTSKHKRKQKKEFTCSYCHDTVDFQSVVPAFIQGKSLIEVFCDLDCFSKYCSKQSNLSKDHVETKLQQDVQVLSSEINKVFKAARFK